MKEYSIERRNNGGLPFRIQSYNTIFSAKEALFIMISDNEKCKRPFFVDNDFFQNTYPYCSDFRYYCIQEREVTDWVKFSEKSLSQKKDDKILFFDEFRGH